MENLLLKRLNQIAGRLELLNRQADRIAELIEALLCSDEVPARKEAKD